MKLTGNALSMLLKRYRAVLGKCRTLNWLAGMVLAGGLVLGGAGLAMADEVVTDFTPENLNTLGAPKTLPANATIATGIYTLSQGDNFAPTANSDESRYNYVGLIITSSSGTASTVTLDNGTTFTGSSFVQTDPAKPYNSFGLFLVTSGTLKINPGVTFSKNTLGAYGVITSVVPNGSTATINLNASPTGPQIVFSGNTSGGAGAAISNYNNAQMNVGNVLFEGNTVTGSKGGAGGGAVFMGAKSTNLINGATFNNNKDTSTGGTSYGGAIATRFPSYQKADGTTVYMNLSGATMTIGNSSFTGNQSNNRGGAIYTAFYNAYGTPPTGAPTTGVVGSLIFNSSFENNTSAKGGAIYNDGSKDKNPTTNVQTPGKLTISNSTFTGNEASTAGGAIYNDANAVLTLIGTNTFSGNQATQGQDIYNAGILNITQGGTTTLNSGLFNAQGAVLNVGTDGTTATGGKLELFGDAASTGQALLEAGNITLQGASSGGIAYGKLDIADWGSANAPNISIDAGNISSTAFADSTAGAGKIAILEYGSLQTPNLTLTDKTGNGLTMNQNGRIRVNSLTLGDGSGKLTLKGGKLQLHGLKNSALNGGTLTLNANGVLDLGKDQGNPGGLVNANVKVNGGTMETSTGTWTLEAGKEINVTDGYLTVGGSPLENGGGAYETATLDVTKGTFTTSQYAASGSDQTDGTAVVSGGTLVIKKSQVYSTGTTLAQGFQKIHLAAGGAITVTDVGALESLSAIATFQQGLILTADSAQAGNVNLVGMSISDATNNTVVGATAESTAAGAVLAGNALSYTSTDSGSTFAVGNTASTGGDALKLGTGVSENTVVQIGKSGATNTVTLLGGGTGSNLIQNADGDAQQVEKVSVVTGNSLNLGSAAIAAAGENAPNQGGNLGTGVALAASSKLNTQAGSFTVGAVDGDSSASGTVAVSANGTLNAESIGATNGVNTVEVTNGGTLISAGGIKTAALNANGGEISAQAGAIETTTAAVSNGAIVSALLEEVSDVANDIAITASDETTVSNGGIILSKGGSISLEEVTLNGGSIGVGTNQPASRSRAARATEITPGLEGLTTANGNITASGTVTAAANSTNVIKTTNGAISFNGTTNSVVVNDGASLEVEATGGNITFGTATDINDSGILHITANASEGASPTGGNVIAKDALNATSIVAAGNITANDDPDNNGNATDITADTVSAANGTITAGALNVGSEGGENRLTAKQLSVTKLTMANGGDFTLNENADADSTIAGAMNLTGVTAIINDNLSITSGGANINGGSFTAEDETTVSFVGASTIKGGAETSYHNLTVTSGALTIGDPNDNKSTQLIVTGLLNSENGLTLGGNAKAPALAAINSVGATAPSDPTVSAGQLNGNITVGKNSALALGSSDIADANKADATNGGLYLAKPVTVTGKQINVGVQADGTTAVSGTDGKLTVGVGSSTVVDVTNLGSAAAITGDMVASKDAKLTISGAQAGQNYKIISGGLTNNGLILASDNPLVQLSSADLKSISATVNSASNFLPELDADTAAMLNSAANQLGTSGKNSSYRGIAFLSSALAMLSSDSAAAGGASPAAASVQAEGQPAANALTLATPRDATTITSAPVAASSDKARLVTQTIEGAERMVVVGAVPQMTRMASQAAAEAVTQRTSMAIPSGVKTQQATDKVALWVMPLYQSTNGAGMDAGKLDADFNGAIGGIALGADYTFANAIRAGISFNIGGGYATGGGDFADTTNNMNFWGLGAYAGWAQDNIGLSADVSFTSAYNKLTQDLPSEMSGWKDLKADVRSWALATGVKAEYKFETSALDIIPHLGVRYMYLNAEDYKLKSDGTVFKGDAMRQNIWTFPVGVNFSKSFQTASGWNVKPMADLMIVPALGDINASPTGRFTGPDYKVSDQNTQIMDHVTYQGQLGIEFGSDNLNFGLSGSAQFGEKTSGYGVLGSFRYEF